MEEELLQIEEQERQEEAARTIQQTYRNYRAYKLAEEIQGVNPYKDSAKNLKRLKDKLEEGVGLSEEEKKSKGENILTKERREISRCNN